MRWKSNVYYSPGGCKYRGRVSPKIKYYFSVPSKIVSNWHHRVCCYRQYYQSVSGRLSHVGGRIILCQCRRGRNGDRSVCTPGRRLRVSIGARPRRWRGGCRVILKKFVGTGMKIGAGEITRVAYNNIDARRHGLSSLFQTMFRKSHRPTASVPERRGGSAGETAWISLLRPCLHCTVL